MKNKLTKIKRSNMFYMIKDLHQYPIAVLVKSAAYFSMSKTDVCILCFYSAFKRLESNYQRKNGIMIKSLFYLNDYSCISNYRLGR